MAFFRCTFTGAALAVLAGCGTPFSTGAPELAPMPAFADPSCGAVARQRVADAAANRLEPALHARIGQDTYASCMALKAR